MGSIDFNKPERTDPALDIIENIRNSFRELGKLLGDTTITNPFDGLVRLNPTSRRLEKYVSGSGTWEEFLDKADDTKAYDMRTALANHADTATSATSAGTAGACTGDCDGTASNAENLGSHPPEYFRIEGETIPVTEGGTGGTTAEIARTNLDLLQKSANGSDIPNTATFLNNIGLAAGETARSNLGLGTTASYNVGSSTGNVPLVSHIQAVSSFGTHGYYLDPLTNFMIQWGYVYLSHDQQRWIGFNRAFARACAAVVCQGTVNYNEVTNSMAVLNKSTTGFTLKQRSGAQYYYWVAIGY